MMPRDKDEGEEAPGFGGKRVRCLPQAHECATVMHRHMPSRWGAPRKATGKKCAARGGEAARVHTAVARCDREVRSRDAAGGRFGRLVAAAAHALIQARSYAAPVLRLAGRRWMPCARCRAAAGARLTWHVLGPSACAELAEAGLLSMAHQPCCRRRSGVPRAGPRLARWLIGAQAQWRQQPKVVVQPGVKKQCDAGAGRGMLLRRNMPMLKLREIRAPGHRRGNILQGA